MNELCKHCKQIQTETIIELLESINEKLGAIQYQQNPPIIKELNTPNNYSIKRINTTTGETFNNPMEVMGDTWTGAVTFKTNTTRENLYTILNGDLISSLIVDLKKEED